MTAAERGGLVLSLFPGADLLGMAFEEEGFTVVQGPDVIFGRDVRRFHIRRDWFSGIIGGPPCQRFSRLRYLVEYNGHALAPDLIPEYVRLVDEGQPEWFLMENLPNATEPRPAGYVVTKCRLNNRAFGGEQNRERAFWYGDKAGRHPWPFLEWEVFESIDYAPAVLAAGFDAGGKRGRERKQLARDLGYKSLATFEAARRLQGLPSDFLDGSPFTVSGKVQLVGNGVPLPMGRAIARAVKRAIGGRPAALTGGKGEGDVSSIRGRSEPRDVAREARGRLVLPAGPSSDSRSVGRAMPPL